MDIFRIDKDITDLADQGDKRSAPANANNANATIDIDLDARFAYFFHPPASIRSLTFPPLLVATESKKSTRRHPNSKPSRGVSVRWRRNSRVSTQQLSSAPRQSHHNSTLPRTSNKTRAGQGPRDRANRRQFPERCRLLR